MNTLLTAVLRKLTPERSAPTGPAPALPDDYGLLRAVARVDDLDTARSIRAMLAGAGVRSTLATGQDGRVGVLVFPADHARADRLVSWAL